jgi:hypothetical protein
MYITSYFSKNSKAYRHIFVGHLAEKQGPRDFWKESMTLCLLGREFETSNKTTYALTLDTANFQKFTQKMYVYNYE